MSEIELRGKFTIGGGGGTEHVNVSHLRGSGGMLSRKYLILSPLKWLEMHLNLTWCGETCGERVV